MYLINSMLFTINALSNAIRSWLFTPHDNNDDDMMPEFVRFFKLKPNMNDIFPRRTSQYAAGIDLQACLPETQVIEPGERKLIPTGLRVEMPIGCYGRIAPRSGLSLKGIDVCAGVVDIDYNGEVKILLHNHGREPFQVHHGDRVAQFICEQVSYPVARVYNRHLEEEGVDEVDGSSRSDQGFGSSGGYH